MKKLIYPGLPAKKCDSGRAFNFITTIFRGKNQGCHYSSQFSGYWKINFTNWQNLLLPHLGTDKLTPRIGIKSQSTAFTQLLPFPKTQKRAGGNNGNFQLILSDDPDWISYRQQHVHSRIAAPALPIWTYACPALSLASARTTAQLDCSHIGSCREWCLESILYEPRCSFAMVLM